MGRILRTVALSPVEPAWLSFRAPFGMQTTIDMTLYDATGKALNYDVAGQLQLIRRTDGRTQSYAAPAVDIANGKARVTFLTGDLSDRNGYRLRLFGTINGQAELLALGEVNITQTMGPVAMPDDVIDNVPVVFTTDTPAQMDVTLWEDAGKTVPYDLSIVTVSAAVFPSQYIMGPLATFTQAQTGPNSLRLSLSAAAVNALPNTCWWSLRVSTSGQVKTIAEGTVTVVPAPVTTLGGEP